MIKLMQTSEEWSKTGILKGSTILDPDGWDRSNWNHSWSKELISKKEFRRRCSESTMMFTPEYIKGLNK